MTLHTNWPQAKLLRSYLIPCACFIGACALQGQVDAISYEVDFDSDEVKVVNVTATFTPKDSILYMGYGGEMLEKRWATFVHNLAVTDTKGKPVKVIELPDARWKITGPLDREVTLTYEVHLDHEAYEWSGGIDGVAYITDMGVFYTGRTLFILNGTEWGKISVDFELPQNWEVTTPWNEDVSRPGVYEVGNQNELVTAMLFAGTHKELMLKRSEFELLIALGSPEIIEDEAEYRNLAEGVLDYYIALMGGIPKPAPDNPFNKAVVVISTSKSGTDGEVIGNNISILIEKDPDSFSTTISRFIFAHEFFHLWNGKSFFPSGDKTEWFKEGFTNYYTLKALHHVHFLSDETYLDFLGNFFYTRYSTDEGVGNMSMTNGEAKHDHWGLIYSGGMMVAMCQDLMIREASNNEKSIDDLMRMLFDKYGGTNEPYSLSELLEKLSALNGEDQTDFFNSYVQGTNKIPIERYLGIAGFNAKVEGDSMLISKKADMTPVQLDIANGFFGKLNN